MAYYKSRNTAAQNDGMRNTSGITGHDRTQAERRNNSGTMHGTPRNTGGTTKQLRGAPRNSGALHDRALVEQ